MAMMMMAAATKSTMCGDDDTVLWWIGRWLWGNTWKKSLMREHLTYKCISSRRIFTFSIHTIQREEEWHQKKMEQILEPPKRLKEYIENKAVEMCCIAYSSSFCLLTTTQKLLSTAIMLNVFLCGLGYISTYHIIPTAFTATSVSYFLLLAPFFVHSQSNKCQYAIWCMCV